MINIKKKIYIACDHAGFEVKNLLITYLRDRDFHVIDCGAYEYNKSDDFPDFMHVVGYNVSKYPETSVGIVLGGSGIGESVLLNRYSQVRSGILFGTEIEMVKSGREHDNINAVAIGVRFTKIEDVIKGVMLFIETPFLPESRFTRRIGKIENILTDLTILNPNKTVQ